MTSFASNFDVIRSVKTALKALQEKTIQFTYWGTKYPCVAQAVPESRPNKPYTLYYRGVKIEVDPAAKQLPVMKEPKVYLLRYRATWYLVVR